MPATLPVQHQQVHIQSPTLLQPSQRFSTVPQMTMSANSTAPDVVRGVLSVRIADASGVSKTQNGLQLWDPAFTEGFIKGTCHVPLSIMLLCTHHSRDPRRRPHRQGALALNDMTIHHVCVHRPRPRCIACVMAQSSFARNSSCACAALVCQVIVDTLSQGGAAGRHRASTAAVQGEAHHHPHQQLHGRCLRYDRVDAAAACLHR